MVPGKIGVSTCKIGGLDLVNSGDASFEGIEVYERIDDPLGSPCITINAVDQSDAINKNKITGDNNLDIEVGWKNELTGQTMSFKGKLHSAQHIDDYSGTQKRGSGHSKSWSAMGVQPELITSQRFPVEETFVGPTTKSMEKILKDYCKTEKQIEIGNASKHREICISREHPVDSLQKLMKESSATQDPTSAYAIFQKYEKGKPKIVIDTIKKLSEQPPVATFRYTTTERDNPSEDVIINIKTDSAFNTLPRATSRAVKKAWNAGTHTVVDEEKPKNDEGKTKSPAYNSPYSDGTYDVSYTNDVVNNGTEHDTDDSRKRRANFLGHATQGTAVVEVYGNEKITLGSVIKLEIPARTDDSSSSPDGMVNHEVLVTGIRHRIGPAGQGVMSHRMICEVSKLGLKNGGSSA